MLFSVCFTQLMLSVIVRVVLSVEVFAEIWLHYTQLL